jgi:hypothetical protein
MGHTSKWAGSWVHFGAGNRRWSGYHGFGRLVEEAFHCIIHVHISTQ